MSLVKIHARRDSACAHAQRAKEDVTLIAVTKNRPVADIEALLSQGHTVFGENRIQEALEKFPPLRKKYPDIRLHFIGHLQSNKAGDAVANFDAIHSLDRASLATALAQEMQKQNKSIPCFLQVNTGEEPQKGGVAPADAAALLDFCRWHAKLDICGLMCIPPESDIPDFHFALLHKLSKTLNLPLLSMGMSSDLEAAIRYGSTHIRIGSALF